jgi:hypothetical protein
MNPKVPAFQAFLATFRCTWFHVVYVIEMCTGIHLFILQLSIEDKQAPQLVASSDMVARFLAFLCALLSLACFAIPMYVIRPFRHQGATELSVALFVKQIGPWLSLACAVVALVVVASSWLRLRGWVSRTTMVAALLLAVAGAYLARLNIYERMFHPLGAPQFLAAKDSHVDKDDMVIAVRMNGQSRAYPIREMAYHHVVNDTVAGEPIVATY